MRYVLSLIMFIAINVAAADSEPDRFRLFQGYYKRSATIDGVTQDKDEKGVFKIDAQTGNVWVLTDTMMMNSRERSLMSITTWSLIDGKPVVIDGNQGK